MPSSTLTHSPIDQATATEVVWEEVGFLFEAARRVPGACFVYAIGEQDDGPVKIGTAKDPLKRLRSMQTGNPRRLRIEHVLLGHRPVERRLHEYWEPYAIRSARNSKKVDVAPGTEWFKPEIRRRLFPILETAADLQVDFLVSVTGAITDFHLDHIVCQAHIAHGFVVKRRDEERQLAAGAGYIVRRRPVSDPE